jgi:hypothetical protein
MFSLLTQVTVVPGATVISPGMKVLWSMFTVATGPALAIFASSAARRGRQSGEDGGQSQSTQDALWLVDPEGSSRICGEVH